MVGRIIWPVKGKLNLATIILSTVCTASLLSVLCVCPVCLSVCPGVDRTGRWYYHYPVYSSASHVTGHLWNALDHCLLLWVQGKRSSAVNLEVLRVFMWWPLPNFIACLALCMPYLVLVHVFRVYMCDDHYLHSPPYWSSIVLEFASIILMVQYSIRVYMCDDHYLIVWPWRLLLSSIIV